LRIANPVAAFFWPLERKLPLLIAALLCAVVGAFGWLAHEELEHAFEAAATERLVAAAQRMSALLVESARSVRREGDAFAQDPLVIAMVSQPRATVQQHADSFLSAVRPNATRSVSRALWNAQCDRVASIGSLAASPPLTTCPSVEVRSRSRTYGIQPLSVWGDSVMYALILPVTRATDTVGYYVQARVVGSGSSARVLSGLLGRDASLLLGNAAGPPVWSDLTRRVDGPSRAVQRGVVAHYSPAKRGEQLGVMLDVPSTPWVAWAEMPVTSAIAGLSVPLRNVAVLAALCIIVGVFCAWLLSRHVTSPIAELTRAEEEFADGNYSRRVSTARRDELGELLTSFNRMAERVDTASKEVGTHRHLLEAQVKESQELAHELAIANSELNDAITQMKTANRERQSAQSLLDEVLTQAPVGIAVFDGQMRFVRVNDAFAMMDGHPVEGHVGRPASAMMPPMAPTAESHLERVLATGLATTNQLSSSTAESGSRRHWMGSYFPVRGPAGEVTGAGAILVDTTAHVELEAQFLHAQKMDAVGRLAGGVAHDFNNLLTVISSYSEMALQTLPPEDELYGDMQEIHNAADRAARLTKQLLAFSRKQVMTPQVLDLNRVAAEMERMLQRLIGDDISLVLDTSAELGCVRADAGQIEQVIMNLVLNARDAMPDGGRLVVRTADANVVTDLLFDAITIRPGEYVTLSVSDSGVGMSDQTRRHLFEPFYTTKGSGLGTGLGLSTVYGIIKQSGGEIAVKTTPGRGSTFVAYLPRVSDAPA